MELGKTSFESVDVWNDGAVQWPLSTRPYLFERCRSDRQGRVRGLAAACVVSLTLWAGILRLITSC